MRQKLREIGKLLLIGQVSHQQKIYDLFKAVTFFPA